MMISRVEIDDQLRWIERENGKYFLLNGNPYENGFTRDNELIFANESEFNFSNVYEPKNVFGLAYNYKSLVGKENEFDDPLVFLKTTNSINTNCRMFNIPMNIRKIWVECELVIIIKKECRNINIVDAQDYILGFTIGSDVTAQNVYGRDHHLAFSKAADGFAPLHNWFNTNLDTGNLHMSTKINGNVFQDDTTSNRIWDESQTVTFLSRYFTLSPGDIIFTGTPAGAMDSLITRGDTVEHFIENIGTMSFTVE